MKRYRRKKKRMVDWPESIEQPEALAEAVQYVGSQEHKAYPSYAGEPGLRSDASRCDPTITQERAEAVLKQAIKLRCISERLRAIPTGV